jgi:hypothetical protein
MVKKDRSAEQYFDSLRARMYKQEHAGKEEEEENSAGEDDLPFPADFLLSIPFTWDRDENGHARLITSKGSYPKQSIT